MFYRDIFSRSYRKKHIFGCYMDFKQQIWSSYHMALNQQAVELNEIIQQVNPSVFNLLSERGKGIFFPKKGILGQTAEAQACEINATIGSALEDNAVTMHLSSIAHHIDLPPQDVFSYAKSPGMPDLRKLWKKMMYTKNPALADAAISLPIVTSALTHGLSLSGYLFVNPGDAIILPDLFWGNYRLVLEKTWDGRITTYQTFTEDGGFNVQGLKQKLGEGDIGKRIVLLNFPNNPTGYTPTNDEARTIVEVLIESAEAGNDLVVLTDDAYFGLVYESGVSTESLFASLANAHHRILAVKLDGATKEDYAWGFRVGFMTFGTRQNSDALYAALESKLAGAVRGTISNASHPGQSLLLEAYKSDTYENEKKERYTTLKKRYTTVREILASHPEYDEIFEPLPFNSGYFMCIRIIDKIDAEQLRQLLINNYSTGVIATGNLLRIAFSSTPTDSLGTLFDNIYKAGKEITG